MLMAMARKLIICSDMRHSITEQLALIWNYISKIIFFQVNRLCKSTFVNISSIDEYFLSNGYQNSIKIHHAIFLSTLTYKCQASNINPFVETDHLRDEMPEESQKQDQAKKRSGIRQ